MRNKTLEDVGSMKCVPQFGQEHIGQKNAGVRTGALSGLEARHSTELVMWALKMKIR